MGNRTAFIVGHDKTEPGAWCSYLNKSEYAYNKEVAEYLRQDFDIYFRSTEGGYMSKMRKLAEEINPKKYDLVVELHLNSFDRVNNKKGHGCETLGWEGNSYSEALGEKYCKLISAGYKIHNRGHKIVDERGRGFMELITTNTLIVEPFFTDEDESLKFDNPGVYAKILKDWLCS